MSTKHTTPMGVKQRRNKDWDGVDDYPTPPWVTRSLIYDGFDAMLPAHRPAPDWIVWEPSANRGHMVRVLGERFRTVVGTDKHDYGGRWPTLDFLNEKDVEAFPTPDAIITNPPFRIAEAFTHAALSKARRLVAIFARTAWAETRRRYEHLFKERPPSYEMVLAQRATLYEGRVDPDATGGAVAYSWFVWIIGDSPAYTRKLWLPPRRAELTMPTDTDPMPILLSVHLGALGDLI